MGRLFLSTYFRAIGERMKLDLDMSPQEWEVLQQELRHHMSYMGVTCGEIDPWDVFRKVCESIEATK